MLLNVENSPMIKHAFHHSASNVPNQPLGNYNSLSSNRRGHCWYRSLPTEHSRSPTVTWYFCLIRGWVNELQIRKHAFPSQQTIFFLTIHLNATEHSTIHLNVFILHHEITEKISWKNNHETNNAKTTHFYTDIQTTNEPGTARAELYDSNLCPTTQKTHSQYKEHMKELQDPISVPTPPAVQMTRTVLATSQPIGVLSVAVLTTLCFTICYYSSPYISKLLPTAISHQLLLPLHNFRGFTLAFHQTSMKDVLWLKE